MATKIKEKKEHYSPLTVVLLIVLILYCLTFFFLILWGVCASFKVNRNFFGWQPQKLFSSYSGYEEYLNQQIEINKALFQKTKDPTAYSQWRTFTTLLTQYKTIREDMGGAMPFFTYKYAFKVFSYKVPIGEGIIVKIDKLYLNSILYAGGCGLASTVVPCIAAYACARYKYKFSRIMHTTVIITMMIPIVGSQPSEIKMAQATGVMNKVWGLWIMRANFLGLYFLVFYDVCKALPTSFSEAAKIDGANNFQIFFQIAMPLIKNTFMTILLIKFISFWNDYQAAMVFMPSYPTVAIGLNRIMNINADSTRYNHQMVPARMAAVVMTATPVCILFAIFQKRLLGNLTVGGVKG